ncbi:hypothetical protein [Micromonospora sp. 15K316]|uniref:hypothetical protein n=1 Tax=Micromonospora sp. 15K316 TaxID=2530376 RepID=UPI001A9DBF45|nr:hypothetical protein [Micromonospora sp. 15K316]
MAILVDFELIRQDSREVEYSFGFPEKDRRLVIQKDSRQGTPLDGAEDMQYRKAFGKILRMQAEAATWPAGGSYAA